MRTGQLSPNNILYFPQHKKFKHPWFQGCLIEDKGAGIFIAEWILRQKLFKMIPLIINSFHLIITFLISYFFVVFYFYFLILFDYAFYTDYYRQTTNPWCKKRHGILVSYTSLYHNAPDITAKPRRNRKEITNTRIMIFNWSIDLSALVYIVFLFYCVLGKPCNKILTRKFIPFLF